MNTYNGFKNRSTWLVKLHLDNTNQEIYTRAKEIAIEADTVRQFKGMITPLMNDTPLLWKEIDFDALKVDFRDLWDSFDNE